VIVNKKVKDKAYKVSIGDVIEYEIDEKIDDQKVLPENIPLDILYEDDDILAINKPVGMVVHPGKVSYTDNKKSCI
jgi:23S rRNA pseudouridine1911/1915/1917 synthase